MRTQPNAGLMQRRALHATRCLFAAEGFSLGVWGAHVPSVRAHLALSEGELALVLLAGVLGALLSLQAAGPAVARWGARQVVRVGGLLMALGLAVLLQPSGLPAMLAVVGLLGFGATLADVAINAEGSVLEAQAGRKLMSGLHGFFSLGGMAGAASVALLLAQGVPAPLQVAVLGVGVAVLVLGAPGFLLPAHPQQPAEANAWRLPRGRLAAVGLLAAVAMLAEGAMYDWSALYLQRVAGADAALAALAFASFSAAMAIGRFGGDALRERLSGPQLLGGGALLAGLGLGAVLLWPHPLLGLPGFALVGLGLANAVPLLFVAATQVPGVAPARGIASVASLGLLGFLAGPPLIGALAQASSLRIGLGLVLASLAVLALAARRL